MGVGIVVGEFEGSAVGDFGFGRLAAFPQGVAVLHPSRGAARIPFDRPPIVPRSLGPVACRLGAPRRRSRDACHPRQSHPTSLLSIPGRRYIDPARTRPQRKDRRSDSVVELSVERIGAQGDGIAFLGGRAGIPAFYRAGRSGPGPARRSACRRPRGHGPRLARVGSGACRSAVPAFRDLRGLCAAAPRSRTLPGGQAGELDYRPRTGADRSRTCRTVARRSAGAKTGTDWVGAATRSVSSSARRVSTAVSP